MRYRILSHTADLRLKVYGKDLEELFQNSVIGLSEIIFEGAEKMIKRVRGFEKIKVKASDPETLLVGFLSDVLTMVHTNQKVYVRAKILKISPVLVEAQVSGFSVPGFQKDVKAVSYHDVEVKRNKKGTLETTLTLDI